MSHARTAAVALLLSACVRAPVMESVGRDPPPSSALPSGPVSFELESLDERSVSAPAFRGKPAVLAFLVSDTLAGQAEAGVIADVAARYPDVHAAIVAVEPPDKRELVQGFARFFTERAHGPLLAAMADKDTLLGQGPFGDVRSLTVVVLARDGAIALRRSGVVPLADIARVLSGL